MGLQEKLVAPVVFSGPEAFLSSRDFSPQCSRPPVRCAGFTLIELMIVVGLIGILVAVTGPVYQRYQRRSMQSEAKLALAAIYSLEKGFHAEYAAYSPRFTDIGYRPEGARQYYAKYGCYASGAGWTGNITGYVQNEKQRSQRAIAGFFVF